MAQRTACDEEVILGLSAEEARVEAARCIDCPDPSCQTSCPNENPIRDVLALIAEDRLHEAIELKWSTNALPSCTGRVCPWEEQCEGACILNNRGAPVRIGAVERYLSDWALERLDELDLGLPGKEHEEQVAVVGAGPGGMAAAHFLRRLGYPVTVYDAWHAAGGVMRYGIPEFVLPEAVIEAETDRLRRMGVKFRFGVRIGEDVTLSELVEMYAALFISIGANEARRLDIPGKDLAQVWTAKEFLSAYSVGIERRPSERRMSASERHFPGRRFSQHPEIGLENAVGSADSWIEPATLAEACRGARVVVIGAGNTAMDAARAAVRLGAGDVQVLYRRSEAESPSRKVEVEHAVKEGVRFQYLVNPVRFLGENGRLTGVRLIRMALGPRDESGRPRAVEIPGSEFDIPADVAVLAIGYEVEKSLGDLSALGIETDRWGCLVVDPETGETTRSGVYAGGDCVTGAKTVASATAAGRRAAYAIDRALQATRRRAEAVSVAR